MNDIVTTVVMAGLLVLMAVALFSLGAIGHAVYEQRRIKHAPPVYVPVFQRGDCFNGNVEREVWETFETPDGIIERVGNQKYLVLLREEADLRRPAKYASSHPIVAFDSLHTKVGCPQAWVTHR